MIKNNIELKLKSIKNRWVHTPILEEELLEVTKNNISDIIGIILLKKGIKSSSEATIFFSSPLTALINPFEMLNMEKGVNRIIQAISNNEKICIYGDYDVDGITSTSLLYIFLKSINANIVYYIPNRLEEGYGLNAEAIKGIFKNNVTLIITVDCGITSYKEAKLCKDLGIDIIITDHHQPSEELPLSAYTVINPIQSGDRYTFKYLSGVGIAFKIVTALRHVLNKMNFFKGKVPNIKELLDIATLGTVADVVPLIGENRVIVTHGLSIMSGNNVRAGIDELKYVSGIANQKVKSSDIGFLLAPRINAAGRLSSSNKGFKLLITENRYEARVLASELEVENRDRQNIEKDILKESIDLIEREDINNKYKSIILHSNKWHSGVIGIVASRIVDKYYKPTIILTEDGDYYKGSARSIPGFHLYNSLSEISDLLVSFGGHKYAAGLKLYKKDIDKVKEKFDILVTSKLMSEDFIPEIYIDYILEASDITIDLYKDLLLFAPYGAGNKEPVFCLLNVNKYNLHHYVGKEKTHLKCIFEKEGYLFDSIGYNMKDYNELVTVNNKFDILFTISLNNWKNQSNIQLIIKDIKVSEK